MFLNYEGRTFCFLHGDGVLDVLDLLGKIFIREESFACLLRLVFLMCLIHWGWLWDVHASLGEEFSASFTAH